MLGGFPRRNDANHVTAFALTVTHKEELRTTAHAKHQETILAVRVWLIVELNGQIVIEHRLRILKGDSVLFDVQRSFGWVPFKPNHLYIVWMIVVF